MTLDGFKGELKRQADPSRVKVLSGFFKTRKGEYGEGDIFLGICVPKTRAVVQKHDLSLHEIKRLLDEKVHEFRLAALLMLVKKYERAGDAGKKEIAEFYIANAPRVNNWDFVDASAPQILGDYLFDKDKSVLLTFAGSENLWERRIAIVATFGFIKQGRYDETMEIAERLMSDEHDLIHKASGWMLREVGKRDSSVLESFLEKHAKKMPRTMLRYAIERFDAKKRKGFLDMF